MNIENILSRHNVAVLQFSGGKDSLACLWLLKDFWPRIHVAWVNTGDAFPETLELMSKVRALVPHFIEISSDVRAQQEKLGYPTDVLPMRNHPLISMMIHPHERPKLQSFHACCLDNLWLPMLLKMQEIGATLIIRGQRNDEWQKSPVRSGDVILGIEYLFPIEDWSAQRVREFLGDKPLGLPAHYATADTSLDCMHCTAHLFENIGKRTYMRHRHPSQHAEVTRRLDLIAGEIARDVAFLNEARAA